MTEQTCCCGCCSVAKGTLAIGIFNIVGAILGVTLNSMVLNDLILHPRQNTGHDFFENADYVIAITSLNLVWWVVNFFVSCLMLLGYYKRIHRYILPWLYWNYVFLAILGGMIVALFVKRAIDGKLALELYNLIKYWILFGVKMYFVHVVYRFLEELQSEERARTSSRMELAPTENMCDTTLTF